MLDRTETDAKSAESWLRFRQRFDQIFDPQNSDVFANLETGVLTYNQCRTEMLALSHALTRAGVEAGDRIIVRSVQNQLVIPLYLSMMRSGIVPVIADAEATDTEIATLLELCSARALVTDAPDGGRDTELRVYSGSGAECDYVIHDLLKEPAPEQFCDLEDIPTTAMLVLTSGTTATPKAVELTFSNIVAQLDIFEEVYGFDDVSRLFNPLPLHHVDGLVRGPLATMWCGGSIHRPIRFSVQAIPAILDYVETEGMTHFISVPAALKMVLRAGNNRSNAFRGENFRFVLSSADLLEETVWKTFENTFGVPVANSYGLSEVVCDALFAGPSVETRRHGTLGRPVGCEATILDGQGNPVPPGVEGELTISGPTVMRGYFDASGKGADAPTNGTFHTGDIVILDGDGFFRFVGRKKTAIVSAGMTIHPETATQILAGMPGVSDAFAFGIPDSTLGEKLVAAIVPEPGTQILSEDTAAYCRERLSPERSPRDYLIVDSLPRTASGKVVVEKLRDLFTSSDHSTVDSGQSVPDILEVAAKCFKLPVSELSMDSTPFNTAGWDSLAHIELIDTLEEHFDIVFSAEQIAQIMSLEDAQNAIDENLSTADHSTLRK